MKKASNLKFIFQLAWKNIRRNKRRTILAGLALFLVTLLIDINMATEYGSLDDMKYNFTHNELGAIRVRNPRYTENERITPLNLYVENTSDVIEEIKKIPHVVNVLPKISTAVAVYRNGETKSCPIYGVDFVNGYNLSDKDNQILEGDVDLVKNGNAGKNVIVSRAFAQKYDLHAGDKFTFMARTASNGTNGCTVKIAAIVNFADSDYSGNVILMDFYTLSNLLRMNGNAVQLLVVTDDWENNQLTEKVLADIKKIPSIADYEILPWYKGSTLYAVFKYADIMYSIMALIFFLLSAIVIFNSTLMSVMERKKEIGSLLSLGMGGHTIVFLFLLETIIISFIAATAGSILSAIVITITEHTGINMAGSVYDSSMSGFNIKTMLYPHLDFKYYLEYFAIGFFTAVIASIIPSRMALKVQPAEALRSEN